MLAKREERDLDQHGDDQDREAEIADQAVEIVDRDEQRLGDEVEPAPIDQKIEAVELELLVVIVDDRHFLRAGEQPRIDRGGCAGRNSLRIEQVIGLIGRHSAKRTGREARPQTCCRVRQQHSRPIFVGDADPTIGHVEIDGLFFGDVLVSVFLQAGIRRAPRSALHAECNIRRSAACRDAKSAHKDKERSGLSLCW